MQENTKSTLKIYWQHASKHPWLGLVVLLSTVGAALTDVIAPLYYKKFFDALAGGEPGAVIAKILISILFIIAGLNLLQWIFWRISTYAAVYFQTEILADLSNTCFKYLHRHSHSFFNNNFVGSLVKRVNWFTRAFEGLADKATFNLLPLVVNIIVVIAVLTYKNAWLGLIMVIWLAIYLVINWFLVKYKLQFDIRRSAAESETTAVLADTVTNQSNVKLFGGYWREVNLYGQVVNKLRELRVLTWNLNNLTEAVQAFLMFVLELGIFYYGIMLWQKGQFTIGDFVLLQSYFLIVFSKIWDFGRIVRQIYQDLADAEEMTAILNTPHQIVDAPGAQPLTARAARIDFKDVSFNYHETRQIIKNFNLTISPGEKLGLVGSSGAGKTTIVKLLLRMYDLSGGKILVDGQNIAQVTQESLWQNISLVPQDPILFHRSLMENIRYGKPEASDEEVFTAAKLAHCHEFIIGFPEGYNTFVGERGVKLSGGERQRVAIARAILRGAPILVLDEATSSLDSESERLIQAALDNLMKGKTVIVIAHRLSTIMKMDRIVVVENGQIVEEGSHSALLKKHGGLYKKLWEFQAGGFLK